MSKRRNGSRGPLIDAAERFQKQKPGHKINDKNRLLWERWSGPMQGAAQSLNAAIANTQNILAAIILEAEGFSTDTHVFNLDTLTIHERATVTQ